MYKKTHSLMFWMHNSISYFICTWYCDCVTCTCISKFNEIDPEKWMHKLLKVKKKMWLFSCMIIIENNSTFISLAMWLPLLSTILKKRKWILHL